MRVTIIGTGYVGLVSGACLAALGHNVVCVENDTEKLARILKGSMPFYEPGLSDLVAQNARHGRLTFSSDLAESISGSEIVFIAVGTPASSAGCADLSAVHQVAREIGYAMTHSILVVNKSTVPVGTAAAVKRIISEELASRGEDIEFDVASNPEFLKEGNAIEDFLNPDRVVIGTGSKSSEQLLTSLYAPLNINRQNLQSTAVRDAEMIKYAANTMLATKISLMNEIALMCDRLDVDVEMVKRGISSDSRIGPHFINPGCGYGGSCFPKDVAAMSAMSKSIDIQGRMFDAVQQVNHDQQLILSTRILDFYDYDLSDKVIAVWGLSFKPGTDDIRESAAIRMCQHLIENGASLRVYDPKAMAATRNVLGDTVVYCETPFGATAKSNVLLLATEWPEFRLPDLRVLKSQLSDQTVFDGRNLLDPDALAEFDLAYCGIGRRNSLYFEGLKAADYRPDLSSLAAANGSARVFDGLRTSMA